MLFGKDGNRHKEELGAIVTKREARDLAIEIPSGPGMHGFSGLRSEAFFGEARPAEADNHDVGGLAIASTGSDDAEEQVEDLTLKRGIQELAVAVEDPDDAAEEGSVPGPKGQVFMIIHYDERDVAKIHSFPDEPQAQAFVEELLSQGVSQGSIQNYRAFKLDFEVSLRPVVHFKGA